MVDRIRLSRVAGWKMPSGTVIVDRRSSWGNPYAVRQAKTRYRNARYVASLVNADAWLVVAVDKRGFDTGPVWGGFDGKATATRFAVELYRRMLDGSYYSLDGPLNREWYLGGLRDAEHLACWCPIGDPDSPCHADVLVDLLNAS